MEKKGNTKYEEKQVKDIMKKELENAVKDNFCKEQTKSLIKKELEAKTKVIEKITDELEGRVVIDEVNGEQEHGKFMDDTMKKMIEG